MIDFIFDLETTGLMRPDIANIDNQPKIIEICVHILIDEERNKIFHTLVNPEEKLTRDIIKKTKITDKMLVEAPTWAEISEEVNEYISHSDRMIAHNVMFDARVLQTEEKRLGNDLKLPELICTMEHTEYLKSRRLNLSDLYRLCTKRKPPKGTHRANVDTMMLERIYKILCRKGIIK